MEWMDLSAWVVKTSFSALTKVNRASQHTTIGGQSACGVSTPEDNALQAAGHALPRAGDLAHEQACSCGLDMDPAVDGSRPAITQSIAKVLTQNHRMFTEHKQMSRRSQASACVHTVDGCKAFGIRVQGHSLPALIACMHCRSNVGRRARPRQVVRPVRLITGPMRTGRRSRARTLRRAAWPAGLQPPRTAQAAPSRCSTRRSQAPGQTPAHSPKL